MNSHPRLDRFDAVDQKDLEQLLYPLLKASDQPTVAEMLKTVLPLLEPVLDHTREAAYLDEMAAGHYRPELLFPNQPDRHLSPSKKNP